MSVHGVKPPGPPLTSIDPADGRDVSRRLSEGDFSDLLARALETSERAAPSTEAGRSQLQAVKLLIQMEILNMNTSLLKAFSPALSESGDGEDPMGGLSSGLETWMNILNQIQGESADQQQAATDALPPGPPEKGPVPSGNRLAHHNFDAIIEEAAAFHGVDPNLVRAVVKTESAFQPEAVSSAGAMGLMQLMPGTAEYLGVKDPFDPVQNVNGGVRYLRELLDRYSWDLDRALAAYNWGPGNLDRSTGSLPQETRNYIRRVNAFFDEFAMANQA